MVVQHSDDSNNLVLDIGKVLFMVALVRNRQGGQSSVEMFCSSRQQQQSSEIAAAFLPVVVLCRLVGSSISQPSEEGLGFSPGCVNLAGSSARGPIPVSKGDLNLLQAGTSSSICRH